MRAFDNFVLVLLGVTGLWVVIAFLRGQPHDLHIVFKVVTTIVYVACLNGARISFNAFTTGQDADNGTPFAPGQRFWLLLSGFAVVFFVWGCLFITA